MCQNTVYMPLYMLNFLELLELYGLIDGIIGTVGLAVYAWMDANFLFLAYAMLDDELFHGTCCFEDGGCSFLFRKQQC